MRVRSAYGSPATVLIQTPGALQGVTLRDQDSRMELTTAQGEQLWASYPHADAYTSELLSAMRVVKMYAWEKAFARVIEAVRRLERQDCVIAADAAGSGGATITIPGGGGGVGGASEANFAAPPVASTWTQQNFDATRTSLTDFTNPLNGVRIAEAIHSYGNTNALRAALRAVPGTNWQATARVRRHTRLPQFGGWGLVVRDASGGRSCILGFINEAGGIGMLKLTNDTTYNSFQSFGGAQMPWRQDIWLRLKYDGTECTLWHSFDGVYWSRSAVVSASAGSIAEWAGSSSTSSTKPNTGMKSGTKSIGLSA